MSPSVYDTAQVLRHLPSGEENWPVVQWLLGQQHADGGWGEPVMPLHRDIPTLAALLALRQHDRRKETREALDAGLLFLRKQAPLWTCLQVDELPVAAEILVPHLLEQLGLPETELSRKPYAPLVELGERKRRIIAKLPLVPGVPWIHVWETWGTEPSPGLMDGAGSIGHSPSATAAWVKAARHWPELAAHVERARAYLKDVSLATETDLPGLVPVGAPHTYFEQSFMLYALLMGGVLDDPRLAAEVGSVVKDLGRALTPKGIGMSDHYLQDGDDTSAVVAVLRALGRPVDAAVLQRFQKEDHFIAYPGEMNSSPSLTARCVHALALSGRTDLAPFQRYLLERQGADGRWRLDKWNRSWLYTTFHSVIGLLGSSHEQALRSALQAVLTAQTREGGWSSEGGPNLTETSYAVLMLGQLERQGVAHPGLVPALERAFRWMLEQYRPFARPESKVKCWISKELYRMERVDTAFELSALLMLARRH